MKTVIALLVVVVLVGGAIAYYATHVAGDPPANFRTVTVKKGDLISTISATGTVEPEEVVDVGAQVAGRVLELGSDPRGDEDDPLHRPDYKGKPIDYTSPVHQGTVLARIDNALYQAQRDQAQASLERANADLGQLQAKLTQADQDLERVKELHKLTFPSLSNAAGGRTIRAVSDSDYEVANANYDVAGANLAVGMAAVGQAKATLEMAQTNLDYTVIKSPVEGVIIDRRVNIGQTVVASLNAPSLFLIAKNLKKMQVWASVNEADIGRIEPGCKATFTVDAFPKEVFRGEVGQVRLNAQMTQNVVTYTVVVTTDNSDLKLKPYLTANVLFEIEKHRGVLKVPNAALRWRPPRPQLVAPDEREKVAALLSGKGGGRENQPPAPSPGDAAAAKAAKDREDRGRLWLKDGNFVRPVEVQIVASDGSETEVAGDDLKEGMEVVVGVGGKEGRADDTTNPFAPKLFRGKEKPKE